MGARRVAGFPHKETVSTPMARRAERRMLGILRTTGDYQLSAEHRQSVSLFVGRMVRRGDMDVCLSDVRHDNGALRLSTHPEEGLHHGNRFCTIGPRGD